MNDVATKHELHVLIADDEPGFVDSLNDAFSRCNDGELRLRRLDEPIPYAFVTKVASSGAEISGALQRIDAWDAIIIDRRFEREPLFKDLFNRGILRALRDLHFQGVAIVLSALDDKDCTEAIESMRLGAWDYLDKKNPRYEDNTFADVIVSIFMGIESKRKCEEKAARDREAQEFIVAHYGEVYNRCKGRFVAFEKNDGRWQIEPIAANASLFGLYLDLEALHQDSHQIHLAWIQE